MKYDRSLHWLMLVFMFLLRGAGWTSVGIFIGFIVSYFFRLPGRVDTFTLAETMLGVVITGLSIVGAFMVALEWSILQSKIYEFDIKVNNALSRFETQLDSMEKIEKESDEIITFAEESSKHMDETLKMAIANSKRIDESIKFVEESNKHMGESIKFVKENAKYVEENTKHLDKNLKGIDEIIRHLDGKIKYIEQFSRMVNIIQARFDNLEKDSDQS